MWMKSKLSDAKSQVMIGESSADGTVGFIQLRRYISNNFLRYYYANGSAAVYPVFNDFFLDLDNQWIHIVTVCDYTNKTMKVYRNGVQFDITRTLTTPIFPSTNRVKYIGSYDSGNYKLTDGSLDEVRIYNRGLSAEEVMARYNQTQGRYK